MVTAKIVTRARAEGLVILLVALGYVWQASLIPALFQSPGVPGPAAFPRVLGLVLGLAGLWRLLRGGPGKEADRPAAEEAQSPPAGRGRFYLLWAVLLGFLTFMPELGFPVAACVALAVMFRLLGEERWRVILPLSLGVTVLLYLLFTFVLGVRLPLGLLQHLLGR
jgi:putative tricarboxylic transport membrane protein